jgi:large subunit ribosomal protein L3
MSPGKLGLLGTKIGMTQVFLDDGSVAPVTILELGPCPVLQVRTHERDGYNAIQMGFKDKERRKATRAERGHVSNSLESKRRSNLPAGTTLVKKADVEPQRFIREFRLKDAAAVEVGKVLQVEELFKDIVAVDIVGTSKGRGFTGVLKRHNFGGLRHSHGVKKGWRQRGSICSNASNRGDGRPKKGIRMAGQHGNARITVRNLEVVRIDATNNILLVRGAVPGPNGGLIMVRPTQKTRKVAAAAK